MKLLLGLLALLVAGWLLLWIGLRVPAPGYPPLPAPDVRAEVVPLPAGLPTPVERFYRELYGGQVPVIETAVISGRGTMRVQGVTLPVRFRFLHVAGHDYRHEITATLFGIGVLKVDELFLDGTARLDLPFGTSAGPAVDQGANLAVWAEAVWMPSVWVTDPRVRWEHVDDHTALLRVPFGPEHETFVARFDPASGLLWMLESMRYRGEEAHRRVLWLNEVERWERIDGSLLPETTTVTWLDEGRPWAQLRTEQVVTGVPLGPDLRAQPADSS